MLKALIVDDEPKNIRILKKLLEQFCPQVEICGEADSSAKATLIIKQDKPDVVFLDIEMPYENAFDMLDKLIPVNFEIIFTTAFDAYVLKAFKYSALDYLLKPVSIRELKEAVARAELRLQHKRNSHQLTNLLENLKSPNAAAQKIALNYKDALIFKPVNDIVRCEAQNNYCYIFTIDNQKFLGTTSIKEYEEILPKDIFFRVHTSHLINLNHIRKYLKGRGGIIEMEDGAMIDVAIRRKDEFLARFGYK